MSAPETVEKYDPTLREIEIPREPVIISHYDRNRARKGPPLEVPAEIEPLRQTHRQTQTVIFEGGPLDGIDMDLPRMATTHQAAVPFSEPAPPVEFDRKQYDLWLKTGGKQGSRMVVRGDYDAVNYKRSSRRTPEGYPIFELAAAVEVP